MNETIGLILEAVHKAIDRYGSKFFVTVGAGYVCYSLGMADKVEGWMVLVAVAVITLAFLILRYKQGNKPDMNGGTDATIVNHS